MRIFFGWWPHVGDCRSRRSCSPGRPPRRAMLGRGVKASLLAACSAKGRRQASSQRPGASRELEAEARGARRHGALREASMVLRQLKAHRFAKPLQKPGHRIEACASYLYTLPFSGEGPWQPRVANQWIAPRAVGVVQKLSAVRVSVGPLPAPCYNASCSQFETCHATFVNTRYRSNGSGASIAICALVLFVENILTRHAAARPERRVLRNMRSLASAIDRARSTTFAK